MYHKTSSRYAMIFALAAASSIALAQNIAVLKGRGGHDNEFDSAFKKLGWSPAYYPCTQQGLADFVASAERYDVVLAVPLFNFAGDNWMLPKDATDGAKIKTYLEKGGMLVMTDGSYGNVRDWLASIDPSFGGLTTGKCTSSQWGVLGHTTHSDPPNPIRYFPNPITEGDSWPHFNPAPKGSRWTPIAFCSEGCPVTFVQEVGKGLLVLTALRQPNERILENYYANSQLRKSGVMIRSFELPDFAIGKGQLKLELMQAAPAGSSITYEIVGDRNQVQTFTTNVVGTVCDMDFNITLRGPVTAALHLDTSAGRKTLFRRQAMLPPLLQVAPNAYRGILSTKRRLPDVDFKVSLTPATEDFANAAIQLAVYDGCSNWVASAETTAPTNSVAAEMWVPVALPKELAPGGYRLDATLSKGRLVAKASTSFEILAPRVAQTVIDEDNTFLVNGKPFFPLGVYHTAGEYEKVANLGLNSMQFWKWEIGDDGYGAPVGLHRASSNRLKCLFESNHSGVGVWKSCVEAYGDHPAILMWYVADEPAEGSETNMKLTNDTWHQYDKHHPTYLLSCRPDLFKAHHIYGDVFAFDPYAGMSQTIDWIERGHAAVDGRKPLVNVTSATPKDSAVIYPLAFAALAHDVRGFYWYCWKQAGGGPVGVGLHNNESCQAEVKRVCADFRTLMPGILSATRRPFEKGAVHGIVFGQKPSDRNVYLVMVNTNTIPENVSFTVPEMAKATAVTLPLAPKVEQKGKDGKVVLDKKGEPILIESSVVVSNGLVEDEFKPYEVRVYKW